MPRNNVIPFRRASGSWDADMRRKHNDGVLERTGHKPVPQCHDDITWLDVDDIIDRNDDSNESKET